MSVFGSRLREARMNKGITQQKMATFLDVQLRTYQNYEQGVTEPSFEKLARLSSCLGVTTDWLLGLEAPSGE